MTHFVLSFRIHSDSTYHERYDSFMTQVHALGGGSGSVWEETSSFAAFNAEGTAESICDSLYYKSKFDQSKDGMLLIDLDGRKKATKGALKYLSTLAICLGF